MSVSVSDDTYSPRIPPSERSDGFRWYFSFYCRLLNDAASSRPKCILLDNPGVELHIDGQRDIKRFLQERMANESQIIYVTHSPAMIDPFNLAQVRRVELLGDHRGTKVTDGLSKSGDDFDLLEPIRLAIGASLVSTLVFNEYNILVEGAADKPIVDSAMALMSGVSAHRVNVNGSVAESRDCILARVYKRGKLPFVVLLDGDSGGRDLKGKLASYEIHDEVVLLSDIFTDRGEIAIEDIIGADFYHRAVRETYPRSDIQQPEHSAKKRVKRYEELFERQFDFGFSRKRVAETLARLIKAGDADTETAENLRVLVTQLASKLNWNIEGAAHHG